MTVCTLTWTDPDPRLLRLLHQRHACLLNTSSPHSRHECKCGLNRYEQGEAA